ncbi:hypothetical protein GCM10023318_50010 [Nocardia callitridis]|uniref:Uncharacterized protein n=2 Tax=Nocardia callitridis TaxID=648753 RepID=A0ABP9KU70_9NOCA
MSTKIYDENGIEVGHANRTYYNNPEGLIANHSSFFLQSHVRGQGCSTEFNNSLFAWYEQSGVSSVTLKANIDVGSYAWARQDFHFANQQQAVDVIRPRLNREITNAKSELKQLGDERDLLPQGPERDALNSRIGQLEAELQPAEKMRKNFTVGSPDFPTPRAITELGRPPGLLPGQSQNHSWLGKRVFMEHGAEIHWHGVKSIG